MVKKIMNEPQNIVDEMLEGFVFAHEEIEWFPNYRVVALKEKKKGKVGIMSVGGSGHEPAHAGNVGCCGSGKFVCISISRSNAKGYGGN
mgnify:CR=1 FL=1